MSRFNIPRSAKITVLSLFSLAAVLTAVIGFAHTKAGRPLLAAMGGMGGASAKGAKKGSCPLGYDVAASPEQKEAAREKFAAGHHGAERAVARPALGFTLDKTTRADVLAWAASHNVSCTNPKSGYDLDCSNVPDVALPERFRGVGLKSLWLNFGSKDTLIAVIAVRRDKSADAITATYGAVTRDLATEAGPPASMDSDASAKRLASGPLQQASAEYRFRNYYALTRATNMGDGFLLTEEYRSLPD